jgi:hypothetical protein
VRIVPELKEVKVGALFLVGLILFYAAFSFCSSVWVDQHLRGFVGKSREEVTREYLHAPPRYECGPCEATGPCGALLPDEERAALESPASPFDYCLYFDAAGALKRVRRLGLRHGSRFGPLDGQASTHR